ncbi:cell envelope biogenesis protein OmpA [Escherichia coli]|nr:cell envelope biogenesis protein OmpA [Escherichia coli]
MRPCSMGITGKENHCASVWGYTPANASASRYYAPFATGVRLKDGSTKVLVDALVNIRAKPGWLILVAGYTDATGDEKSNQQLSLRRAEAVRNWMLQTSDIPATCFAVQGLGESQPAATNDTPQGRAVNRRVEISLVPRSDACQDVK